MSSAVAFSSASETRWTIVSGALAGQMRVMNAMQFTIGRGSDCEFVISHDPRCSRRHAAVVLTPDGCEVSTLNDKNPVLINGREVQRALLREGDVLTIGETELQFSFGRSVAPGPGGEVELALVPPYAGAPAPVAPGYPPAGYPPQDPSPRPRPRAKKPQSGGGPKRLVIYGVLGLIGWWLFSGPLKKKEAVGLRTKAQIEADIEAAQKLREVGEELNNKRVDSSVTSRQAQENYVRGFRDYRDGQFERSIVSFQACLALNPEHVLCNRYHRLAQRKFNELIQYHVVLGRKYRDQNQYKACRAAFRNVMVMVKDASSPIYKEAKANYEACNTYAEGRF